MRMLCRYLALTKQIGVARVSKWTRKALQRREEDYWWNSCMLSTQHRPGTRWGEQETREATKAPENAGIEPTTMKMKNWYQEQACESDDSQFQSPSHCASDTKTSTRTNRTSYQAREPIKNHKERAAMRQGTMPPTEPERIANPRIREDRTIREFNWNRQRYTVPPTKTPTQEHEMKPKHCVWWEFTKNSWRPYCREGDNSMHHYRLVRKFIFMPQAIKNWQRKKQWINKGENWRTIRRGIWRRSETCLKWSKKQDSKVWKYISHHWWTFVIWRMQNWRRNTRRQGSS